MMAMITHDQMLKLDQLLRVKCALSVIQIADDVIGGGGDDINGEVGGAAHP